MEKVTGSLNVASADDVVECGSLKDSRGFKRIEGLKDVGSSKLLATSGEAK